MGSSGLSREERCTALQHELEKGFLIYSSSLLSRVNGVHYNKLQVTLNLISPN